MKKSFSDRFLRKTSPAVSLTDLKTDSPDKPKGSPARSRSGIVKTTPNEKTFTDFAKLSLIGKGAVGKVYVVVEKDTFMMYAMKVLSKQEMIAREKVGRVMLEKDMLISLNHPFIVPLHHCFQSPNYIYMIMDYCAGGELYNVLQRSPTKTLSESVAKFIIAEIISALEYLHLQGYIYRDLKPENILVQASGHIMLADFDLSKDAGESEAKPEIIKSRGLFNQINAEATLADMKAKSFVGTEEYVSPEALLGNGYSSSVDWWSTGVLLYEMLYGSTPFVGKNQKATFRNILRKDPPFKHTNKTQSVTVSTEAKAFIKKMLIKVSFRYII
jgi:protein-serine/threonine kinase